MCPRARFFAITTAACSTESLLIFFNCRIMQRTNAYLVVTRCYYALYAYAQLGRVFFFGRMFHLVRFARFASNLHSYTIIPTITITMGNIDNSFFRVSSIRASIIARIRCASFMTYISRNDDVDYYYFTPSRQPTALIFYVRFVVK